MKCEICGTEHPAGKKFCTLCGNPLGADSGTPATAPAFQPQYAPPPKPPDTMPGAPGVDQSLIADILLETEKKKKRPAFKPWAKPEFWLAIGSLMLLPSLYFPWFHLYPGHSAGAFSLPISFLLTGQQSWLPILTSGLVLAALFIVCAALSLKKDRIATWLRAAATLSIALSLLAGLSAFRAWNLMDKNPDVYLTHVKRQVDALNAANTKVNKFIGGNAAAVPQEFTKDMFKGRSGVGFVREYLGLGALFAFAGGLFIIFVTYAFARRLKFLHYDIAPTPMAAIIVVCTAAAILFCVRYFLPDKWYMLEATAFQSTGLRGREEAALKKCSELAIPSPSCEIQLAELYYDTQRNDKAFEMFSKIIEKYPRYVDANKYLGLIYFKAKNYEDSARHFRRYLEINTSDIEIKKKLADALQPLGDDAFKARDYAGSLKLYLEAYGLLPSMKKQAPLAIHIAECYEKIKDNDNAAKFFKSAADLDKTDPEAQIKAAEMLEKAKDYEGAVIYYAECTKIKADYTECYVRAGDICLKRLEDKERARDWYQKAIKANDLSDWAQTAQKRLRELE